MKSTLAYVAWVAAETAWDAELRRRFGTDACNARYTEQGHGEPGSELSRMHALYVSARAEFWIELGEARAALALARGEK